MGYTYKITNKINGKIYIGRTIKNYEERFRQHQLNYWDEEDIIQKYYDLKSARKVAKIIGCDHSSIDKILNRHNIKRFTLSESVATTNIIIERDDFKKIFSNTRDCGKWFIDNNYTRSKDINNVTCYLRERLRKNKPYCNFKVYYESKI